MYGLTSCIWLGTVPVRRTLVDSSILPRALAHVPVVSALTGLDPSDGNRNVNDNYIWWQCLLAIQSATGHSFGSDSASTTLHTFGAASN